MIQDTASATFVAKQAALRLYPQVMVATPVAVGVSGHWMDHPGTLTLRPETFLAVVYDLCESLKNHGLKHVLILNGHAGNSRPLRENVAVWQSQLGIDLRFHSYWQAYTPEARREHMESGRVPGHAAEFETSFAMAAFPERVHWDGVDYEASKAHLRISDPKMARDDEQFAQEAKLATTAKGEAMITIAVDWVVARLQEMIATT
jgi:creatinine amidohydrolase/Fe(II)-dependent formamide hydrolase-like protein